MNIVEVVALLGPIFAFIYGYSFGHDVGVTDGRGDMYKELKNARS